MLKANAKQSFTPSVSTSIVDLGTIRDCFAADYILYRAYNGPAANALSLASPITGSLDGILYFAHPGTVEFSAPTASINGNGIFGTIRMVDLLGTAYMPFLMPFIKVKGSFSSGTGGPFTPTFEFWPIYEAEHPNLSNSFPGL
jgi:hypothetical protein